MQFFRKSVFPTGILRTLRVQFSRAPGDDPESMLCRQQFVKYHIGVRNLGLRFEPQGNLELPKPNGFKIYFVLNPAHKCPVPKG